MQVAAASSNSKRPYKLIGDIGSRQISVSETIWDRDGEPVHDREQRSELEFDNARNRLTVRALMQLLRLQQPQILEKCHSTA